MTPTSDPVVFHLRGSDSVTFTDPEGELQTVSGAKGSSLHRAFRAALSCGHDPDAFVQVLRGGKPALIVRGSLGVHAQRDLRETDQGFKWVKWRPCPNDLPRGRHHLALIAAE